MTEFNQTFNESNEPTDLLEIHENLITYYDIKFVELFLYKLCFFAQLEKYIIVSYF